MRDALVSLKVHAHVLNGYFLNNHVGYIVYTWWKSIMNTYMNNETILRSAINTFFSLKPY